MKKGFILVALFSISSLLLLIGCKCPSCQRQEDAIIPSEILKKANQVIINRTGEEYFDKYIKPEFSRIKYNPPYYDVVYRFYMPEKPYVDALIKFSVDSVGRVAQDRDFVGVPDCREDSCSYNINKEQAVKIAKDNGLVAGIKEWQVGFIWSSELKQYVWRVISTTQESESSNGKRASGKEVVIDPNTGLVLALNDWHVR